MRRYDPEWQFQRMSDCRSDVCSSLFMEGETVILLDSTLIHTPSNLKDAILSGYEANKNKALVITQHAITTRDCYDIVFACLSHGFLDFQRINRVSDEDNVTYQDVGRDGEDDLTIRTHTKFEDIIECLFLAQSIEAHSVVRLIVEELHEEFQNCILSVQQIKDLVAFADETHGFLQQWTFEWDGAGMKTADAVKKHTERVEEALKEVEGYAKLIAAALPKQPASSKKVKVVKAILKKIEVESEARSLQPRGRKATVQKRGKDKQNGKSKAEDSAPRKGVVVAAASSAPEPANKAPRKRKASVGETEAAVTRSAGKRTRPTRVIKAPTRYEE